MTRTGPKPLSDKEYFDRHRAKLNASLQRILGGRHYLVKCKACKQTREVSVRNKNLYGKRCVCTHKKVARLTLAEYRSRLSVSHKDYRCVAQLEGARYRYKHKCGSVFDMSRDCFKQCKTPCPTCRPTPNLLSTDEYKSIIEARQLQGVTLVGSYTGVNNPVTLLHACGHTAKRTPDYILRAANELLEKCEVCYPNRCWFSFTVAGVAFRTRSLVEKRFVEWLVHTRKVPVSKIEYEPSIRVRYKDPLTGRLRHYTPDFKIGNTYVEVKSVESMGLKKHYRERPGKEVFKENRAKAAAASKKFDDYRIYVLRNTTFLRLKEQT